MAIVHSGWDARLDRPVAVKFLADNLANDPEIRARFLREALLSRRLSHPNIVQVLDQGEFDDRPYIVLELVTGPSLAEELARVGRFSPERAGSLGAQVAAALAYAHAEGLVHRDVKPHNVLLTAGNTAKLADFGIARAADAGTQLTQIGTVLGTAAYLAPEQAAGEKSTSAADMYAFGIVLCELLTGRPVHSALPDDVPEAVKSAIDRCLAADPARRPSANQVERVLRGVSEAPTRVLVARAAVEPLNGTWRGMRRLLATAAALAAVAAALGLGLAAGAGSNRPAGRTPRAPALSVPTAPTAAGEARNLARWLRAHAG
jgi:eukaryotic-like serine/threonine-protein kinase